MRRLCCDGSLVAIVEREDGTPLDVGRKTRAVPPAWLQMLKAARKGLSRVHDLTVENYSLGTVFSDGRGLDLNLALWESEPLA